MPDPTFTTPPDAPSRASPSTFSSRTDAFLAWMVTFKDELAAAVSWFSSTASSVSTDAATTTAAKEAAIAAANAAPWVSAASYTALDVVISPVDYQPYRAKTTHSGLTTDPSADATNWDRLYAGFSGSYNDLTDVPAAASGLQAEITNEKASGTGGGTMSASYWTTRTINTVVFDPTAIVSLSANEFTSSVACQITWSCPGLGIDSHKTRLVRVSNSAVIKFGSSEMSSASGNCSVSSTGSSYIEAGVAYKIEHWCSTSRTSSGQGSPTYSGTNERYGYVRFWS
jgi:hypothetical protein